MPCAHLCREPFEKRFIRMISELGLDRADHELIKCRYVDIVTDAEADYARTTMLFIALTNIITIGGVLLISFLPLEKVKIIPADAAEIFYWISWVISIIVTIAHKSLFSFNIPRKYVLNTTFLEKYYSEGWQFAAGINRYTEAETLEDRVKMFISRVEHIKLKSLEIMSSIESSQVSQLAQKNSPPIGAAFRSAALMSSDNVTALHDVIVTGRDEAAPDTTLPPGAPQLDRPEPDRPAADRPAAEP